MLNISAERKVYLEQIMSNINILFLEEYKRIDNICCDIFHVKTGGVSRYIDEMTVHPPYSSRVGSWENTLATLKHMRHIRNELSHSIGTLEIPQCNEHDLEWLQGFHESILTQTDPLSLCRMAQRKATEKINTPKVKEPSTIQHDNVTKADLSAHNRTTIEPEDNSEHLGAGIVFFIIMLFAICILVLFFYIF